jgi:hypothetical protein
MSHHHHYGAADHTAVPVYTIHGKAESNTLFSCLTQLKHR